MVKSSGEAAKLHEKLQEKLHEKLHAAMFFEDISNDNHKSLCKVDWIEKKSLIFEIKRLTKIKCECIF